MAARGGSDWARAMGGIEVVAGGIAGELRRRLPRRRETRRGKLALLVATMLGERSANLMDLAAALPRPAERVDMRYRWIGRPPGDGLVEVDAVMAPYAREALARLAAGGRTVALLIDQTRVSARHQVVTLAARVGGRALPLAWRVRATEGAVGFVEQREALEAVAPCRPRGRGRC
jgi:hypothetical protein